MLARILAFFTKKRLDRELEAELASHVELLTDDNVKRGMDPAFARREALLKIGSFDAAKELHRETRGLPWVDTFTQDSRLALRMIQKSPWISGIAILSLAIGIGANITGFAIARTILWQPLPVPQPERLVALYNRNQNGAGSYAGLAYPEYEYLRNRPELFDGVALYVRVPSVMEAGEETERVVKEIATSNFFSVLGVQTILGRGFQPGDDRALGSTPEAVLSYALWQRRFSGDPKIIGKSIRLDGSEFTIIGVVAEEFRGVLMDWVDPPQVWIPMNMYGTVFRSTETRYGSILDLWLLHSLMVTARLKAGVTIEMAQSEVRSIDAQMTDEHPERVSAFKGKYDSVLNVLPLQHARFFPAYRPAIVSYIRVVAAIMAIVLVIACLNLANLMIARASTRAREMVVRAALGATRFRLVRQMVVESLMLSCLGGLAALPIAMGLWRALLMFERPFLVVLPPNFAIDVPMGLFVVGVSVGTGVLFGVWPALRASKVDLNVSLKQQKGTASLGGLRVRAALIALQIAASMVLLVGASLFIRTIVNAQAVDRFVDRTHVGIVDITIPVNRYSELLGRIRGIPGVERAGLASVVPGGGSGILYSAVTSTSRITVDSNSVSTGFFTLMGIPLLSGRDFTESDKSGAPEVVIVNEGLAQRLWPGMDPIGRDISGAAVIGVVRNIRARGVRRPVPAIVYHPVLQGQDGEIKLMIQTKDRPAAALADIRQIVRQMDPGIRIVNPTTLQDYIDKSLSTERLTATLVSSLGIVGLCLTLIGLYGVVAFAAVARTREIGIRIAVGAQVYAILRMMFVENISIVIAGILLGLFAAFGVTRAIHSMLFGVESTDPVSLIIAAGLILVFSSMATLIPSWSVTRLDPSKVLRNE